MDGVMYFNTGTSHVPLLCVSLWSLRQFFDGPAVIACSDDAVTVRATKAVAADARLNASVVPFRMPSYGRNTPYVAKTQLHPLSPFDRTLFVDSDTVVTGRVDELWPDGDEVVLTQFADWHSQGPMIRGRLEKWSRVASPLVRKAVAEPYPAVNTGVLAYPRGSQLMDDWMALTPRNPVFICDETCMQIIYPHYPHRVLDDRYNRSGVYGVAAADVRIWHFHGGRELHPVARPMFVPAFRDAWDADAGGLRRVGRQLLDRVEGRLFTDDDRRVDVRAVN